MPTLLVIDDHELVRKGLKFCLEACDSTIEVQEAASGRQALRALDGDVPYDLALLDITLPGEDGIAILKKMRRSRPTLPILVLTMHPESQYGVRALKAGAAGYLTKNASPTELLAAIRRVASGGHYVGERLAEHLADQVSHGARHLHHTVLSDREFEVLRRIARGEKPSAIGSELGVAAKTVQTHRARILQKLGLSNTSELIRYALENRLVD